MASRCQMPARSYDNGDYRWIAYRSEVAVNVEIYCVHYKTLIIFFSMVYVYYIRFSSERLCASGSFIDNQRFSIDRKAILHQPAE